MRCVLASLTLSLTLACVKVEDPCDAVPDAPVTVCVEDQDGDPLPPTELSWSFHPESAAYDGPREARCVDAGCTVWALPAEAVGDVVVLARYVGPPHFEPGCVYADQATETLSVDPSAPELLILTLDTEAADCV